MRTWLLAATFVIMVVSSVAAQPQPAPAGPQKVVAVRAGRLVDPESGTLELQGITEFSLDELREAWEGTLPRIFG